MGTSPVKRFPVTEWRKAVIEHSRKVELYVIDTLANTSSSSTLTLLNRVLKDLKPAKDGSLATFPLIDSNVRKEAANWIRIRLLCGTTSLNESMSRITRATSQRTQTCLVCGEAKEDTCHFLLRCEDPEMEPEKNTGRQFLPSWTTATHWAAVALSWGAMSTSNHQAAGHVAPTLPMKKQTLNWLRPYGQSAARSSINTSGVWRRFPDNRVKRDRY